MKRDNTIYFPGEKLTFFIRDAAIGEHFAPEFIDTFEFISRYSRLFPDTLFIVGLWDYGYRWNWQIHYWVKNGQWSLDAVTLD